MPWACSCIRAGATPAPPNQASAKTKPTQPPNHIAQHETKEISIFRQGGAGSSRHQRKPKKLFLPLLADFQAVGSSLCRKGTSCFDSAKTRSNKSRLTT
ncbi:hypothetical protein [Microcystis phage Mea-Yong924-1]|nr:hypothetical protein [Microcystis phage Mea-Yong924-1]